VLFTPSNADFSVSKKGKRGARSIRNNDPPLPKDTLGAKASEGESLKAGQ